MLVDRLSFTETMLKECWGGLLHGPAQLPRILGNVVPVWAAIISMTTHVSEWEA